MSLLNGMARVQFLGTAENGQRTSNSFHILKASAGAPPDVPELTTLATQIVAQFSTTYRAVGSTVWTWNDVNVANVVNPTTVDVYQQATASVNLAGTRAATGSHIPTGVCAVLALKSSTASRRYRGHLFLPPAYTSSSVTGDGLDVTNAYYLNAALFALELKKGTPGGAGWTGSSLSGYKLVVYSKAGLLGGGATSADVTDCVVRGKASFLRSRERGGT